MSIIIFFFLATIIVNIYKYTYIYVSGIYIYTKLCNFNRTSASEKCNPLVLLYYQRDHGCLQNIRFPLKAYFYYSNSEMNIHNI
jgi:hypothetical protein